MSFSRLRESRGYSIVASLVVVAILILIAVAIEATVPPLPAQQSMNAAAGATDLSSDPTVGAGVVAQEQTDEQKKLAQLCQAAVTACQKTPGGCNAPRTETSSSGTTGAPIDNCVGAVPDGTVTVGNTTQTKYRCSGRSAKATFIADLSGGPGSYNVTSYADGSVAPGQCKTVVCTPDVGSSPIANLPFTGVTSLKCGASNTTGGLNQNNLSSILSSSNAFNMTRSYGGTQFTPASTIDPSSQSIIDSVYGNSSSNQGAIPYTSSGIIGDPSSDQINSLANSAPTDLTTQQSQQQITAIGCNNGSNPALCGNNSVLDANASANQPGTPAGGLTAPDPNKPYYIQQTDENGKLVWCDQSGNCKPADSFTPSQSQVGPAGTGSTCAGIGPPDAKGNCPSANGNTFKQPPVSQPPANQPAPSTSGGGIGNFLGNLFGYNAANNVPQSPFGGACMTRYVCQGSMLYYQTPGNYGLVPSQPIIGQQQCQTMPVQQCPYGCMAMGYGAQYGAPYGSPYGSPYGAQPSNLSTIGMGLQLFSGLMGAFGGGSTMANPYLSSQCAMTPQQAMGYQSPYGVGSDGQQCYQPPPQPDPSQCTAGTWRPTSANQNGCITGYQCVPNGSTPGGTGTTPTAQLSCQPQIADVGTPISFSYACGNATGSTGTGFSTGGALSGTATTSAPTPPSGTNQVQFALTCVNQGVTASAQCQVQLNKPGIVMITNPRTVKSGDSALIGWVTAGMQSCTVSSPDDQDFTARNAGNTSPNGAATTSPITTTMNFRLDCTTLAGATKTATTTVSVASN